MPSAWRPRIFRCPASRPLDREEMELFLLVQAGYEPALSRRFLPRPAEERLLIAPPEAQHDVEQLEGGANPRVTPEVNGDGDGPAGE